MIATTRQMPGLFASSAAGSIVVFGSDTFARLSHDRTGFAFAMSGLGAVCISNGARPPAPPPGGCGPPARCGTCARPVAASIAAIDADTTSLRFARFIRAPGVILGAACRPRYVTHDAGQGQDTHDHRDGDHHEV